MEESRVRRHCRAVVCLIDMDFKSQILGAIRASVTPSLGDRELSGNKMQPPLGVAFKEQYPNRQNQEATYPPHSSGIFFRRF